MSSTSPRYPPPGGYPPRPPTIDDLEARAVSHWQDNRIHITSLWKAADNWRNRGQTYEEQEDLQSAFVAYTSARSLVLEVIPVHPDYNKAFNEEQKSSLAQNGERILADLAGVKEKLLKQQEEWDRKYGGAAQPSEGDHALTTTLLSLQMNGSQGGLDDSAQINSPQEQQHQPHDEEAMWRQQTEDITPQTVEEDVVQQAAGVPSPTENGASSASLPDSLLLHLNTTSLSPLTTTEAVQDTSVRDRDRHPLLNVPSNRPGPKHNRVKWVDEDQGDEAIIDALLDGPRSEPPEDGVDFSMDDVVKQVTEVLSKSNIRDQLLGLSVGEAQCTLDFLQDLLDVSGLPMISKRTFLKTTLKLTRIHDCVPRCLTLKGFKKTGDYSFARGSYGEVWRGQVEGMEVAVKQARIFTGDNNLEKVLWRVRREAIIWKQCNHPNVLPFYGIYFDPAPSIYSLVSPFMVNGSLCEYINKVDGPDRHDLALDITRGMNYLHTLSIVHSDLKGDNVLITDDRRAVIADFGVSFMTGFTTVANSSPRKAGTLRYQAPEVLKGGLNSFSADVYSLACVYLEVFEGTVPWSGLKDPAVILEVVVEKKHPPYPRFLSGLTEHAELWREVMTKCWSYKPQDRPNLPDIMASLHMTDNMPTTESKWDRSVPTRLHAPFIKIPSGLPRFFNLERLSVA